MLVYNAIKEKAATNRPTKINCFLSHIEMNQCYIVNNLVVQGPVSLSHNYNKIVKSDWLSTALILALIGQFKRTVCFMPK